jgi:hypothetical protein
MNFKYNDGGRAAAGYKGQTGDCVTRSIAIVTGLPYQEVYDSLSNGCRTQRITRGGRYKSSASNGVNVKRKWFRDYMEALGFQYVATMGIGSGCKTHLRSDELPKGRLVVQVSKHYTAVIDGVINDTYDPSRGGTRCVYGYWVKR